MAFPSVPAPYFVSIFAPMSILLPLLRRIEGPTLLMMIEDFEKDINNSLKEIQVNR